MSQWGGQVLVQVYMVGGVEVGEEGQQAKKQKQKDKAPNNLYPIRTGDLLQSV